MQPWDVPGLIQRERRRASQTLRGPTFAQLLAGVRTICERLFGLDFVEEKIAQGEAWHPDVLKFVLYDGTAAVPSALHSGRYRRVLTSPTKSERISESTSRSVCESHDHSFCVFVPRKFKICRENYYSIKFRRIAVQLSIFWDRTRGIKIRTH